MLDFDKPLTKQPKNVKLALAKLGEPQEKLDAYDDALLKALFEDAPDPGNVPRNPSGAEIVYKLENKLGKAAVEQHKLRGKAAVETRGTNSVQAWPNFWPYWPCVLICSLRRSQWRQTTTLSCGRRSCYEFKSPVRR